MGFRYKVVKQLGDGTYGSVWKAMNRQTNEVVRIRHSAEFVRRLAGVVTVSIDGPRQASIHVFCNTQSIGT
jgi:serine/threonine protein kinase